MAVRPRTDGAMRGSSWGGSNGRSRHLLLMSQVPPPFSLACWQMLKLVVAALVAVAYGFPGQYNSGCFVAVRPDPNHHRTLAALACARPPRLETERNYLALSSSCQPGDRAMSTSSASSTRNIAMSFDPALQSGQYTPGWLFVPRADPRWLFVRQR